MDLDCSTHPDRFKCIGADMLNLNGARVGFIGELPDFERIGEGSVDLTGFALEYLFFRYAITDIVYYRV